MPSNQWAWYQRNGFSMYRENHDFWAFLIPGVGEAPVISFLLLVSLIVFSAVATAGAEDLTLPAAASIIGGAPFFSDVRAFNTS